MDETEKLLSEGLDLCVRARKMDEIDRRNNFLVASTEPDEWQQSGMFDDFVERWNHSHPDKQCATRSLTIAYWVAEQYRTDLADWERRAREHLMKKWVAGI